MSEKSTSAKDILARMGHSVSSPAPIAVAPDAGSASEEVEERASVAAPTAPAPTDELPAKRRKGVIVGKTDPTVPRDTVRFSLDLDRSKHKGLKRFALDCETDASVIGRLLVDLLLENDEVAETVRARHEQLKQLKGE